MSGLPREDVRVTLAKGRSEGEKRGFQSVRPPATRKSEAGGLRECELEGGWQEARSGGGMTKRAQENKAK